MRLKDIPENIENRLGMLFKSKDSKIWRFNTFDRLTGKMHFMELSSKPTSPVIMEFTIFDKCMEDFTELQKEPK